MNPDNCPREVFISSQQDIATGPLSRCTGPVESIIITSASDEQLNFPTEDTRRRPISNIVIRDNSELNIVTLPNTNLSDGDTFHLEISGSPALKTMNASQLYGNAQAAFVVNLNMSDIDHGDIYFPKDSKVNDIYVYNSHAGIHNIQWLSYLKTTGTVVSLYGVSEIQTMEIEQPYFSSWIFSGLEKVHAVKWTHVSVGNCAALSAPFTILEDMAVGPSIFDEPPTVTQNGVTVSSMMFDGVGSIGQNLNITENMFDTLDFSFLENINGQLRIEDNTNCTLLFNGTTSIGSIYAANNTNTILPGWFPNLKQVNDIFLNGYINSSLDSNIFPSLEIVANSIRLEPWNSDFDCAAFLDRARTNGFGSPSCNITAMDPDMTAASAGPSATPPPPPSSTDMPGTGLGGTTWTSTTTLQGLPSGSINTRTGSPSIKLSRVQWGIIGTGISVSFLICCFTAYYIWCLPAHKKWLWLRREERRQGNGTVPDDAANQTEPETNTERKEMPHEADGTQVVEAGGREVPHRPSELGNTAVIAEMWAPTTTLAELP